MTTDEQIQALRRALVRLLWNSVADEEACSCDEMADGTPDPCANCEAFKALGLGEWPGWVKAANVLVKVEP